MGPLPHLSTSMTTRASTPSNAEGPGFPLALPPPVSPAPTTVASISPEPTPTSPSPLTQALFTLSPTRRTSDPVPTVSTPTGLLFRGLEEKTGYPSSTSSDYLDGPTGRPTASPSGMGLLFDDDSLFGIPASTPTMSPTDAPTSSLIAPTSSSTLFTIVPTSAPTMMTEAPTTDSSSISPEPTQVPSEDSDIPSSFAGDAAVMMLVLAVVGIIVVSSGSTLKAREGGDGRGSSSAGSRTLAPLVLQSVIVPGVTSGDCDGEERASTRRPSMTLAVILLIQLQLLATLSLAKDENKEHVMWEFVKSLRIINFWWSFGDDAGISFYPAFEGNTALVSGIFLGICFLHFTILSGVEASWLTTQRAQEIMAVTNCYDRSLSTSRMAASFRKPRFTRRTSPQLELEESDGPRYSGSKRLTSTTEENSSDEEKGVQRVSATHSESELGPVETCREKSNSGWLFFPHVELEFLLIAFHGSVASQAWAIHNSSTQVKVYAVIVLVIYPVLVVAVVCRAINVRVRPNMLLIFNACNVDDDGRSAPNGHGFLSKLKTSWSENDSFFSWADKGRWETVDVQDAQTRRDGDRFRIGFEPIFVDYTKSGVWFVGFFLVQWAATACVGVLLIGNPVWQLSLFCGLQASVLVVLLWLKPFLNSVVNAMVTCLVVINVITFALLAISTYKMLTSDMMFNVVSAAQLLGLFGLVILIYMDVVKVVWGTMRKIRQHVLMAEVMTGGQLENRKRIREFTRRHWFGTWCAMIRLNLVACAKDTVEGMRRRDPVSASGIGPDDPDGQSTSGPIGNSPDPSKVVKKDLGRRMPPEGSPKGTSSTSITALEDVPSGKKLIQPKDKSHEDESPGTSSTISNTRATVRQHAGGEGVLSKNVPGATAKGIAHAGDLIRNASFNDHNATNDQPSGKELIKQGVERSDRTIEGERPNLDEAPAMQSEAPSKDSTEVEPSGGTLRDFSIQSEDSTKDAISLSDYSATRADRSGKELIQQGPNKSGRDDLVPRDLSRRPLEPGLSPQLEESVEERLPFWSPVPQGIHEKTVFSPNPGSYGSGNSFYISNDSSSGTASTLSVPKGPSGREILVRGSSDGTKVGNNHTVKPARAEGDSQRTSSSGSVCMDSAAGSKHSSSHSQGDGGAKGVDGRAKLGHTVRQTNPPASITQEGRSIGCIPEHPQSSTAADSHLRRRSLGAMTYGGAGRGMIWPFHLTPQNPIPDSTPRGRSITSPEEMIRDTSGGVEVTGTAQVPDGINVREEAPKRLRLEFSGRIGRSTPSAIDCPLRRQSGKDFGRLSVSSSGRSHVDASETEDDPDQTRNPLPRSHGQRNVVNKIGGIMTHRREPIKEDLPRRRKGDYAIQDLSEGDSGDGKQENDGDESKKRRLSERMGVSRRSGGKQALKNETQADSWSSRDAGSGFGDFPTEDLNNGLIPKRAVESSKPCRRRPSSVSYPVEGRVVSEHEQDAGGKSDACAEEFQSLKEDGSAQPDSAVMEKELSESGSGTEKEGKIASW